MKILRWISGLTLACGAVVASAQYVIDWHTMDGGGGDSAGGPYTLSGTIGQPDAHTMTGGDFDLVGGYWAMLMALDVGEGPALRIEWLTPASALIAWPVAGSDGFVLQHATTLLGADWSSVATLPVPVDGEWQVTVTPMVGVRFYRLRKD